MSARAARRAPGEQRVEGEAPRTGDQDGEPDDHVRQRELSLLVRICRVHVEGCDPECSDHERRGGPREQAKRGGRVTNQRHEIVNIDEFSRRTLQLLDGTRDRAAVLDAMAALVADGTLMVEQEGQKVAGGDPLKQILGDAVDRCLTRFAKAGLCVA